MIVVRCIFIVIGVILLVAAGLGKIVGDPHVALGYAPKSLVELANTVLLLGLSASTFTKKR